MVNSPNIHLKFGCFGYQDWNQEVVPTINEILAPSHPQEANQNENPAFKQHRDEYVICSKMNHLQSVTGEKNTLLQKKGFSRRGILF